MVLLLLKQSMRAAYQAQLDATAAASVRTTRNTKLAETDWTGMSDVTMSTEMATYRQALARHYGSRKLSELTRY